MNSQIRRMAVVGCAVIAVAICCSLLWLRIVPPRSCRDNESLKSTVTDESPAQVIIEKREAPLHQTRVTHIGVFDAKPSDGKTLAQMNRLCGVNCLYLINQYYGVEYHYNDLQRIMAPTDMGTSLQRLKEVAEALGYATEMRMIPVEELCSIDRPTIVLAQPDGGSNVGHFVVVAQASEAEAFVLYDPPYKKRLVRKDELADGRVKSVPALFLRYEERELAQ